MRQPLSLVLASAFSVSLAAAATISIAHADVKIVTKVTTTGAPQFGGGFGGGGGGFRRGGNQGDANGGQPAPPPQAAAPSPDQTYTTYFKGRKARRESADGNTVVIYDRDADKIYTLDPKAKTYYSTDYKTVLGETTAPANNFMRQDVKVNLTAATTSGAAVGGVATRAFTVDGTQTMTMNTAAFAGRQRGNNGTAQGGNTQGGDAQGGRRGGFGGFGGMSTAVTGNISLASPAAVLPTDIATGAYDRTLLLPLLAQLQPVGNQIFPTLMTSIARQQAVPLAAKITLQRTVQMNNTANNGGETPAAPPTIPPTTITMEVQSIDKNATLDNALFTVPADFKVVEAPRAFGFGGRGGRGGGNGGGGGQNGQGGGGRQRRQRGTGANQNPTAL
jgi:uncharacterized membrane protein YgcG